MLNQTGHELEQPLLRFEKAYENDHTEFENNSPTSFVLQCLGTTKHIRNFPKHQWLFVDTAPVTPLLSDCLAKENWNELMPQRHQGGQPSCRLPPLRGITVQQTRTGNHDLLPSVQSLCLPAIRAGSWENLHSETTSTKQTASQRDLSEFELPCRLMDSMRSSARITHGMTPTTSRQTHSIRPPPKSRDNTSSGGSKIENYECAHAGCKLGPFRNQYLLDSHKKVHTNDRPYYCPIGSCSRGAQGKGFKRKNDLKRHGLVHNSPGYLCPFCAERKRRYPRADNLQRHVRKSHIDIDKNDPRLLEVLSQKSAESRRSRTRR